MNSDLHKIEFKNKLNITDKNFNVLKYELNAGTFFNYLQKSNKEILIDCKNKNNDISLYIKNLDDDFDEEISLVKFAFSYDDLNDKLLLNGKSKKCEEDEEDEYFFIDFNTFLIEINKTELIFTMLYNPKKYPQCIFLMIKKYFEVLFSNMEKFICIDV